MTPAGIEPATFQYVAHHLNHCATAVPDLLCKTLQNASFVSSGILASSILLSAKFIYLCKLFAQ